MSHEPRHKRPVASGRRSSTSSEASSRAEIERIFAMTPLERMALALALGRRHAELMRQRQGKEDPGQ